MNDLLNIILSDRSSSILLELPTGLGKSRLAIERVKSQYGSKKFTLLIVVNRLVHIDTWRTEITKWWSNNNAVITFTTYASLQKHIDKYDAIIVDECHHLSERCRSIIQNYSYSLIILCSATIPYELKSYLRILFPGLKIYRRTLRAMIDKKVLPNPKVILIPLSLNRDQLFYYNKISRKIAALKQQYFYSNKHSLKLLWLKTAGDRLKWLSNNKTVLVKNLLDNKFNKYRTLTFCNSIQQTEKLGKYCINSKNKESSLYLEKFNNREINHITACNILNEGVNLVDCQVGIFAVMNSSDIMIIQKQGRLLRHEHPILVIPYYQSTREEEILQKILINYDKSLIKKYEICDR